MKNQKQREPDIPWWLALCVVVVLYKGVVFFLGAIFPKESTEWGSLISGVPIMIFSLLAVITCTGGTK